MNNHEVLEDIQNTLANKLPRAFKEQQLKGAVDLMIVVNNLLAKYTDSPGTRLDIGTTMENHVMKLRRELESTNAI